MTFLFLRYEKIIDTTFQRQDLLPAQCKRATDGDLAKLVAKVKDVSRCSHCRSLVLYSASPYCLVLLAPAHQGGG
jgi:predicted Zn-ribbon and HTH transcriptional regulator